MLLSFAPAAALLLAWGFFVLHRFAAKLEDDRTGTPSMANPASLLSADVVRFLSRENTESEDILVASLKTPQGERLLRDMGTTPQEALRQLDKEELPERNGMIQAAFSCSMSLGERKIPGSTLLAECLLTTPSGRSLLNACDLSPHDLQRILYGNVLRRRVREQRIPRWQMLGNALSTFSRTFVAGYTDVLDRFTTDLTSAILHPSPVVINEPQLQHILHILSRNASHNALVIGNPGTGKLQLVRDVVAKLRERELKHHRPITRVLRLETAELLSGKDREDIQLFEGLYHAKRAGHFVIVVEDLAPFLASSDPRLEMVLTTFLRTPQISMIGVLSADDYHTLLKTRPLLDSLFEKVTIEETTDEETLSLLMAHRGSVGRIHVTYKALTTILDLSKRYIKNSSLPGKALDTLSDAVLYAEKRGEEMLTEDHVREVISRKAHINVQRMSDYEKQRLCTLEDRLLRRIVGQTQAVRSVAFALKRARAGMHNGDRPVGTFLFLGPTGVGKTHTAKVLAEEYFGSINTLVRLDMNDYATMESVAGIMGSPKPGPGFTEGYLTKRVQDRPFSLILLDELEKAHPSVLNLFLQILDEGVLIDSRERKTDFRNCIIIATSNAGSIFIRDAILNREDLSKREFKAALIDTLVSNGTFSPEFLNRFNDIILYFPLTTEEMRRVAILLLDDVISNFERRRGVPIRVEEDVLTLLVEKGHSTEFGAREMQRVITAIIENALADELLRNDVRRGDTLILRRQGERVSVTKERRPSTMGEPKCRKEPTGVLRTLRESPSPLP
jgi:ATP-dependent Clp protease ATP-binding subunit ClpC